MSKKTKWEKEYEKNYDTLKKFGEEHGVGAVIFLAIFVIAISFGIFQLGVYAVCWIAGTPYSVWIGLILWILWLCARYEIKIHIAADE